MQGSGKQARGAVVNVCAFYIFAIPTALGLAFGLHLGVEGLYSGMLLGPLIQAVSYIFIISRIDWTSESAKAVLSASRDPH